MGLMDIRRRILADSPVLAEASGAVASFTTDMAVPLKKCEFAIEPVQSGTGDPSPSNVRPISGWTGVAGQRTGVNIWDEEWEVGAIDTDGSLDGAVARRTTSFIPVQPETEYRQVAPSSALNGRVAYYDANKALVSLDRNQGVGELFTTPSNCYFVRITFSQGYGTTYNNDISINYPSTDTAYHAYAGNTIPVTFPAQGKNLAKTQTGYNTQGGDTASTIIIAATTDPENYISSLIKVEPNTAYVCSRVGTGGDFRAFVFDREPVVGETVSIDGWYAANSTHKAFTTSATAQYLFVLWTRDNVNYPCGNVQCELGSTPTAYEPYTNTVYGGTVDVVTGVLTVEWAKWLLNKADITYNSYGFYQYTNVIIGAVNTSADLSAKCNKLKTASNVGGSTTGNQFSINGTNVRIAVDGLSKESGHVEDYQTALGDNVEVCAKLTTPITYQLTPQQITALKGQNNVWCDTGNTTVQYWKH